NSAGATTSLLATLTVLVPPSVTVQPQSRTNNLNASASFNVVATGTSPLSYQWRFNGTNLADGGQFSGASSSSLGIDSVQPMNAGSYSVVVTNIVGSTTSAVAALTVLLPDCFGLSSGLLGWWPGDGNASDIYAGHNGSLQGGATATAPGLVSTAFSFDGTN